MAYITRPPPPALLLPKNRKSMESPTSTLVSSPRSAKRKTFAFDPNINITPEYLLFPPPHNGRAVQNVIYLYNTSDKPCVYKLRSQNPMRYVAKPNVAVIGPKSATRVKVTLCLAKGEETVPAATEERFRISVKRLSKPPPTVSSRAPPERWYAGADPKEVWSSCGEPVGHEKELMAYFRADLPLPPGGMVTHVPEDSTASSVARRAASPGNTTGARSEGAMSQMRTADPTPLRGGPQPSRQLEFDDADTAALRDRTEAGSGGGDPMPRSRLRFLKVVLAAAVLAYAVGFTLRLQSEGKLNLGQLTRRIRSLGDDAESGVGLAEEASAATPTDELPAAEQLEHEYSEAAEPEQEEPAGAAQRNVE